MSKQVTHITEASLVKQLLENGTSNLPGRDLALLALKETPLPNRKTEAFKYTPVAKYLKKDLSFGTVEQIEVTHQILSDVCTRNIQTRFRNSLA